MNKAVIIAAVLAASLILPVRATPTVVSYTATNTIYYASMGSSFNVSAVVQLQAFFDCNMENTTCHINASLLSSSLNITYDVIVLGSESNGTWSMPTPTLLGDSADYTIPSTPSITISYHGNITGNAKPNVGIANPAFLTWLSWGRRDTEIPAEATTLTLNTTYNFFMTITFNVGIPITTNSTAEQAQGIPSPIFPVPEYPTILIFLFIATAAILLLRVAVPKLHVWPKSKNPLSACDSKAHPKHLQNSDRKQ